MRTIKLVIIGDSGVGKTSIRSQYITGRFSTGYRATIGTDFISKTLPHPCDPNESVTLQIWDTAGQERFSSLSTAFFRGADAALLMFDVNKPETLEGLRKWWDEFKARAPVPDEEAEDYCCVVVGNKVDLAEAHSEGGSETLGHARTKLTEAEAERFLEELVPRMSSEGDADDDGDADDPFLTVNEGFSDHERMNGISIDPLLSASIPQASEDEDLEPESPSQTQSIKIQRKTSSLHPYAPQRPHKKRASKSRSSDRSQFGGTMTTTHTIYHTPSSSLFDMYESAASSPPFSSPERSTSPPANVNGHVRRLTSRSSISSAPTITPSLFTRTQNSAAITPPTPRENEDDTELNQASNAYTPLPPPERRPKLFLTSAKTGAGVAPVFEYIARRVAIRWAYDEAIVARRLHMRDATEDTIRLSDSRNRRTSKWVNKMSCCGS